LDFHALVDGDVGGLRNRHRCIVGQVGGTAASLPLNVSAVVKANLSRNVLNGWIAAVTSHLFPA
jgi:hypothetical protein